MGLGGCVSTIIYIIAMGLGTGDGEWIYESGGSSYHGLGCANEGDDGI